MKSNENVSAVVDYKKEFIDIFKAAINRSGSDALLNWLEKSDFFTAPASTRFHENYAGGLCEHSVHVYHFLSEENEKLPKKYSDETIAIVALLHDCCKVNLYKESSRNVKNETTGQWEKQPFYTYDDQLPFGHGEKSVYIVSGFMKLTRDEAMAIRWHMGFSDNDFKGGGSSVSTAFQMFPLAALAHIADLKATYLKSAY